MAVFRNKARGWWQMFKNAPSLSITRTVLCGYVELWSSTSRILDDYASKATEHPRFRLYRMPGITNSVSWRGEV